MANPIFVVGGARDGQEIAVVALLGMGVPMGKELRPRPNMSMTGYFDDLELSQANQDFVDTGEPQKLWAAVSEIDSQRPPLWGAKAEATATALVYYRQIFPDAAWVWMHRDPKSTLEHIAAEYLRLNIPFSLPALYDWLHVQQSLLATFLPSENVVKVDYAQAVYTPHQLCRILTQLVYPSASPQEKIGIANQAYERIQLQLGDLERLYEREVEDVPGGAEARADCVHVSGRNQTPVGYDASD